MSNGKQKLEAPETETEPGPVEATYWHRHKAPIIRFPFRKEGDVGPDGHALPLTTKFRAFFPEDSTLIIVPDHLRHLHTDLQPQGFRSSFTTSDPKVIEFMDAKMKQSNLIIKMKAAK